MAKPVIISGIQPTGNMHIGNYLGAFKKLVALQESGKYEQYIFIADLHSMTGTMSADERRDQIVTTAAELLALGIDPKKTTLFIQSHIPEHAELAWILNTVTPVAELYRMTQFKDKSERQEKNINAGLLTYPVLQAADILLYKATEVPVGQDQVQHLELTKDTGRWFNKRYGEYFPEVKPLLSETPKIMSLLEPTKKMSKSLGQPHVIELADEPETIRKKLKKAVTATEGGGKAPGVENLLILLKHFDGAELYKGFVKAEKEGSIRYGDLKDALAEVLSDYFKDFRQKRKELLSNPTELSELMIEGGKKARIIAQKTMTEIRTLVGLR